MSIKKSTIEKVLLAIFLKNKENGYINTSWKCEQDLIDDLINAWPTMCIVIENHLDEILKKFPELNITIQ